MRCGGERDLKAPEAPALDSGAHAARRTLVEMDVVERLYKLLHHAMAQVVITVDEEAELESAEVKRIWVRVEKDFIAKITAGAPQNPPARICALKTFASRRWCLMKQNNHSSLVRTRNHVATTSPTQGYMHASIAIAPLLM